MGDRLHPGPQIAPKSLDVTGAGEAAGHPDDGHLQPGTILLTTHPKRSQRPPCRRPAAGQSLLPAFLAASALASSSAVFPVRVSSRISTVTMSETNCAPSSITRDQ